MCSSDQVRGVKLDGIDAQALLRPEVMASLAATLGLYIFGLLVILHRLRKVFATLTAGDPFHPNNVTRLRWVGGLLAALEVVRHFGWSLLNHIIPSLDGPGPSMSLSSWFSILVVFVLAEVFREGARLRGEAELTI